MDGVPATPADEWQTAIVYVGDLARLTRPLIFALNLGAAPAPDDLLKLRNVRLCDNRIFPGNPDLDADCDVDFGDIALFAPCITGPGVSSAPPCAAPDLDGDTDVDLFDAAVLQISVAQ